MDACFTSETLAILLRYKVHAFYSLDASLRCRDFEMAVPHKKNCKRASMKDGRLRRYKRSFKVDDFFSWLEDFRRLVVRWEYHAENYLGFVLLV